MASLGMSKPKLASAICPPTLKGRIFVLAATAGKFQVVCEKETRGAVRQPLPATLACVAARTLRAP